MDRPVYDTGFIEDKRLTCVDCGRAFTFTAGEIRFYLAKGLTLYPKRCPECRHRRKLTINREGSGHSFNDVMGRARDEITRYGPGAGL